MSDGILLAQRQHGLGATDASAVLGLNPWKSPLQVWCDKRGLAEPQPESEAMRWGKLLEPVIADEYSFRTGFKLTMPEAVYHDTEHDFLLGTPDRLVVGQNRGVEIKTANAYSASEWGAVGTDQVPQHYLIQCMHYLMLIPRIRVWDLAVLIGGNDFRIYTIQRDDALIANLRGRLVAWWQVHMVNGVEPEAMAIDSDFMVRRYPSSNGNLIPAPFHAGRHVMDLKLARAEAEAADERCDAAQAALKALIGEADGIEGEGWRVTWKANKNGTRVFRLTEGK